MVATPAGGNKLRKRSHGLRLLVANNLSVVTLGTKGDNRPLVGDFRSTRSGVGMLCLLARGPEGIDDA